MMNNFSLYKVFVGVTYGQNWWSIKTSEIFGQLYAMFWDPMEQQGTLCCDSFFDNHDMKEKYGFDDCIDSNPPLNPSFLD